jgi:hypothetical protein
MQPQLIFTAIATGEVIDLPREDEDLLIAIILRLVRDAAILDAEIVGDVLDADEIG